MTEHEQQIYDAMSPREQKAIDALTEELRPAALLVYARALKPKIRPAGHVPWDQKPASRALIDREPGDDFTDGDDSERDP